MQKINIEIGKFEYETYYYLYDTSYLLKIHGNALEKDQKYDAMIM